MSSTLQVDYRSGLSCHWAFPSQSSHSLLPEPRDLRDSHLFQEHGAPVSLPTQQALSEHSPHFTAHGTQSPPPLYILVVALCPMNRLCHSWAPLLLSKKSIPQVPSLFYQEPRTGSNYSSKVIPYVLSG